jgi:PAS domain S-box-containing protein
LKVSEGKYRDLSLFLNSILDSSTVYGIIAIDCDGKIIEFNRGAENLLGWKKEEVLNKESIRVTLVPEDREKFVQNHVFGCTSTKGISVLELVRLKKNGDRFQALSTITAIKDPAGSVTGFVEILCDLTIRKLLERELRETKEFLENIMESCVDGIVTADLKGKVTYMNRSMERIINYDRKDTLGKHISLFYVGGINEARQIMKLLIENERAEDYAMEIKATTGQIKTILNTIFLVRNEAGQKIGTAGLFKDITQQKQLEADLKDAQANLVETSKMRALGELVAGVAHEVNNPLMASQTILHVLMKNLGGDYENLNRLELIRKCNNRIERIVEHLKEFSRQTKPEFEPIDINQPVENALLITAQQLLDHGILIIRNLAPNLPKIIGDSNQIEQVFLNIRPLHKNLLFIISAEVVLFLN